MISRYNLTDTLYRIRDENFLTSKPAFLPQRKKYCMSNVPFEMIINTVNM